MHADSSRRGFTLIELLVVIAIIAILAAILFPVFAKARERGKMSACLSNCRQIGIAFTQYTEDSDGGFPYNPYNANSTPPSTRFWAHCLYPYAKSAEVFRCPSHKGLITQYSGSGPTDPEAYYATNFVIQPPNVQAPANPAVRTIYRSEIPFCGYAVNDILIGGADGKPHKLGELKAPANTAIFGDGIYYLSGTAQYTDAAAGKTTYYWCWGAPGRQDWWGKPNHLGGNTFVYGDGHAAWSRPTIDHSSATDWTYGHYQKAPLNG